MKIFLEEQLTILDETWVEAGQYEVIRFLERDRALIDITPPMSEKRMLTIVSTELADVA